MDTPLRGESIVCFAGEDWWYHHPHSKNHILKRWAGENRVLFVNSIGMGLPAASNPDFFLKIGRKLKSHLRWLRRAPEGLWILSPLSLPIYQSKWLRALNGVFVALQVKLAMLLCGLGKPVIWAAIPFASTVIPHIRHKLLLYQVSDKYDANEDSAVSPEVIRECDRWLKERAQLVMFSGRKLFEEAAGESNRYFLEQAVDFEHFAQAAAKPAAEIRAIPRPILAYAGWIDYVMDTDLIREVAVRRPQWQWVFIGRKSNLVQLDLPNVHFLGPKPYDELPRYLAGVDVCVLPWQQDHEFTSYGSAIKVREYLATGKPVVISPLYEYLENPGVRLYRSPDEFIAQVEAALGSDTPAARAARQSLVRGCTWDVRAAELAAVVASLTNGHSSSVVPVREGHHPCLPQ